MSTARTKARSVPAPASTGGDRTWMISAAAGGVAALAAGATALALLPAPLGLAVTVLGVLVVLAERGLAKADTGRLGVAALAAIAVVWMAVCYTPFHALLFPGPPLHEPVRLRAADPSLPVTIAASGRSAVDVVLEGELPPSPTGGAAMPVDYAVTLADAAAAPHVLSGRFDEHLRTQRLGRRGSATVVQAHHAERHLLKNAAGGDLVVTAVSLEPPTGSAVLVTAFAHRLPSTGVLALIGTVFLAGVAALDALVIPAADGLLTFVTPAALGAALVLWTSNVAHPTVANLIGATIFGAPPGLGVGALLRAIARRTLAPGTR